MLERMCREREEARVTDAADIIGRVFDEAYRRVRSVKEAEAATADFVGVTGRRIRSWRNGEVHRIADDEYAALQRADAALVEWKISYHCAELARAEAEEREINARIKMGRMALRARGMVAESRQGTESSVGLDFRSVDAAGADRGVVPGSRSAAR